MGTIPNGTSQGTELTPLPSANKSQPPQSGSCEAGGTNIRIPQYTEEEDDELAVSDIKGSITSLPMSPKLSSMKNANILNTNNRTISDYFICDNFEFSIVEFDFCSHYKFLIELAIKCLNMDTSELSPSLFLTHNAIRCVVAILHQNNGKKVPKYYSHKRIKNQKQSAPNSPIIASTQKRKILHTHRSEQQREQIAINNVIGFAVCYPHSNCRPYPDSVWMLGWLCADYHRIRSNESQSLVIEAMIRRCFVVINPQRHQLNAAISEKLKLCCRDYKNLPNEKQKKHKREK